LTQFSADKNRGGGRVCGRGKQTERAKNRRQLKTCQLCAVCIALEREENRRGRVRLKESMWWERGEANRTSKEQEAIKKMSVMRSLHYVGEGIETRGIGLGWEDMKTKQNLLSE
jgi:hypothetical protein